MHQSNLKHSHGRAFRVKFSFILYTALLFYSYSHTPARRHGVTDTGNAPARPVCCTRHAYRTEPVYAHGASPSHLTRPSASPLLACLATLLDCNKVRPVLLLDMAWGATRPQSSHSRGSRCPAAPSASRIFHLPSPLREALERVARAIVGAVHLVLDERRKECRRLVVAPVV